VNTLEKIGVKLRAAKNKYKVCLTLEAFFTNEIKLCMLIK
jgi:hypothetical protein